MRLFSALLSNTQNSLFWPSNLTPFCLLTKIPNRSIILDSSRDILSHNNCKQGVSNEEISFCTWRLRLRLWNCPYGRPLGYIHHFWPTYTPTYSAHPRWGTRNGLERCVDQKADPLESSQLQRIHTVDARRLQSFRPAHQCEGFPSLSGRITTAPLPPEAGYPNGRSASNHI